MTCGRKRAEAGEDAGTLSPCFTRVPPSEPRGLPELIGPRSSWALSASETGAGTPTLSSAHGPNTFQP